MVHKRKIALRTFKWLMFLSLVLTFIASNSSKIFQIIHLKENGFNMISYSPISIILGFVSSIALLFAVFIDRVAFNHRIRTSPLQLIALAGGIAGLLYNIFLTILVVIK